MLRPALTLLSLSAALPALADVPQVVVDTGPLHALVARVMDGVGDPVRLLPPGASPHDFQMRPSDAAALQDADLVFWMGEGLVPWLTGPLATLAPEAVQVDMLATDGWTALPLRMDAAFAAPDDHDDDHGANDPHAWLDPGVASVWLGLIAGALSDADPGNAAAYAANAQRGQAEMADLTVELTALLAPVAGRPFVVSHDALQYFEVAFGVPASGAITLSDAAAPGPARIADLQDLVAAGGIVCVLTDPETSADWAAVLADGTAAHTAQVDPDGASLEPGSDLYPALMRNMATALRDCLGD